MLRASFLTLMTLTKSLTPFFSERLYEYDAVFIRLSGSTVSNLREAAAHTLYQVPEDVLVFPR